MRENRMRQTPEVSDGRIIHVGLVGPKPRPKGVGDGQPVNSPVPVRGSEGEKRLQRSACGWKSRCETLEVKKDPGKSGFRAKSVKRPSGAEVTGAGVKKSL